MKRSPNSSSLQPLARIILTSGLTKLQMDFISERIFLLMADCFIQETKLE